MFYVGSKMNITIVPIVDPSHFFNTQWQWNQAVCQYNQRLVANQQIASHCGVSLPNPCFDSILQQMKTLSKRYIHTHGISVQERLIQDISFWLMEITAELEDNTMFGVEDSNHQEIHSYHEITLKALRILATTLTEFGLDMALRCVVDMRKKYDLLFPIDLNSDDYSDVFLDGVSTEEFFSSKPWLALEV